MSLAFSVDKVSLSTLLFGVYKFLKKFEKDSDENWRTGGWCLDDNLTLTPLLFWPNLLITGSNDNDSCLLFEGPFIDSVRY